MHLCMHVVGAVLPTNVCISVHRSHVTCSSIGCNMRRRLQHACLISRDWTKNTGVPVHMCLHLHMAAGGLELPQFLNGLQTNSPLVITCQAEPSMARSNPGSMQGRLKDMSSLKDWPSRSISSSSLAEQRPPPTHFKGGTGGLSRHTTGKSQLCSVPK